MARFLVVDDDHATVSALTQLLSGDGHEVAGFTDSAGAVDALGRESFDAVVTDLEMPRVDGHEVVRVARRRHPRACVVVATAKSDEDHDELHRAGACFVARKPLDYDAVSGAIKECHAHGGHEWCHRRAPGPEAPASPRRK